ncbi:MAG: hypothetical protein ACT4TC_10060 [Myxococcaceae bacterium]
MLKLRFFITPVVCLGLALPAAPARARVRSGRDARSEARNKESPENRHARARARMQRLDFEAALPLLEKLSRSTAFTPRVRADVFLDLGVCHVNVGDLENARIHFNNALSLHETLDLPPRSPPKVRAAFDAVKESRRAPAPPPPALAEEGKPETPARPEATQPDPNPLPSAVIARKNDPPQKRSLVLPITFGALAAAGLASGIVTGLSSRSASNELQSRFHPGDQVEQLQQQRQRMGVISASSYALAGAAAVAGMVSLILTLRNPSTPSSQPAAVEF